MDVMILTGAGQIGMAIARRVGFGKKIRPVRSAAIIKQHNADMVWL